MDWACVLVLESLIPVMVDHVIGKSRLLATPSMKERAKEIAETWKASLEEHWGVCVGGGAGLFGSDEGDEIVFIICGPHMTKF